MALELSQLQSISDDIWEPGSRNNWAMGNVLMWKLLKKVKKVGSGQYVRYVLRYAKSRGGAMSGSTVFDTAKKAFLNAARFPWAYFYSGFTYDVEDEVEISGGGADIDFVLQGLDNAQETLRDDMGISLWRSFADSQTAWGADKKPFYGVEDLMGQANTSPAFGRINMADLGTYTREGTATNIWVAYQNANALVMQYSTMQTLRRNCIVGDGPDGVPDLYVTTHTLWDKLENSIVASQRHYDEETAKVGFDGIKIGSRGTCVADNKCTASYVNAFNFDLLALKAHKDFFFPKPVWKQPTNQALKTTQMFFFGAFGTGERRAHGRLTNVS
uniref:Putative capsid protein n=1 Tax=viral metagenome TaxID=1070528 RepID=A0A6M3IGB1_9ZZZZ